MHSESRMSTEIGWMGFVPWVNWLEATRIENEARLATTTVGQTKHTQTETVEVWGRWVFHMRLVIPLKVMVLIKANESTGSSIWPRMSTYSRLFQSTHIPYKCMYAGNLPKTKRKKCDRHCMLYSHRRLYSSPAHRQIFSVLSAFAVPAKLIIQCWLIVIAEFSERSWVAGLEPFY